MPTTLKDSTSNLDSAFDLLLQDTSTGDGNLVKKNNAGSIISTVDDRLYSVLHNVISLQFFHEFCLNEFSVENILFWIEVEIFKTIDEKEQRELFARYLYYTYICPINSPLAINISDEVRQEIQFPFTSVVESNLFDEAQEHAYAMIKGHAYSRYEKSDIFQKFIEFKNSGNLY